MNFFSIRVDMEETETTTVIHSDYYDQSLIISDKDETATPSIGSINEFHVIKVEENRNASLNSDGCLLLTRTVAEEEEKPTIGSTGLNNCSKPRHVLCETNTLVVQNFQYVCLSKPMTFDLPALISSQLTHELCLSICQELQTKLAILHVDKCYCMNGAAPNLLNITLDFEKHRQKDCGSPCPGK